MPMMTRRMCGCIWSWVQVAYPLPASPQFNADEVFRLYCRKCDEDELLSLAQIYRDASERNLREAAHVPERIERERAEALLREDEWRRRIVVTALADR